jgi:hypothetical protein
MGFAALAVGTSLAMGAATIFARIGLGFPIPLLFSCIAIVALSTLGPALWAFRSQGRQGWIGSLTTLLLIASCGVIAVLGQFGALLVCALALGCCVYGGCQVAARNNLRPSPTSLLLGCAIAVAGAFLLSLELGGTKYVNFLVDQLILHGRADGDDYLNAALTSSLSSLYVPATGIDGVSPTQYHVGFYALAAALTKISGGDAALALIALQMIVLVPILGFALAHGAWIIAQRLFSGLQPHVLHVAALAFVLVPLAQLSGVGNLVTYSTSMLLGGILLTLVGPGFLVQAPTAAPRGSEKAGRSWWLASLAIPLLAIAKISVGYAWTAVIGYLALRKIGLRHVGFWLLGLAMAVLFFGSVFLFAPLGGAGGKLFGTPFYVERGFAEGNYLLPLQLQWQSLAALGGLLLLRNRADGPFRRLVTETLIVAILAANLPGLVMEIPGGDAVYFLVVAEWFALPVLLAALSAAPSILGALSLKARVAGWAVAAAAAAGLLVGLVDKVPERAHTFVAAEALVHIGDRSYFVDHKKRALKADARRALDGRSLVELMQMPVSEPLGLKLAGELRSVSGATQTGFIAFASSQSDFWNLVGECDGKSLWPMAVAGVSLLAGQSTSAVACPDEPPLLGGNLPPVTLSAAPSDGELCALARHRRFKDILVINRLDEAPSRIECDFTISELDDPHG